MSNESRVVKIEILAHARVKKRTKDAPFFDYCSDECAFLDPRDGGYCKVFCVKLGSSYPGGSVRCRGCIEKGRLVKEDGK